jgi:uroporphyrinogen decarboxylase
MGFEKVFPGDRLSKRERVLGTLRHQSVDRAAIHYPYVRRLAAAWREHGYTVLYHSDGNYLEAIPELAGCGMEIVELKRRWPELVWAGGVDGVALMERGSPEQVRQEVRRQILESGVLRSGGMLVATSSEINPLIPAENFLALVQAVGETTNPAFRRC